jgi:hypothetical protein
MNANGKDKTIDFDITKEMTPVKSRYLKKGKGGRKHEEQNSEEDTSDENVLDDESDVEDSDEELKDISEFCSSCFLPPFPFFKYRDFTGVISFVMLKSIVLSFPFAFIFL